ncbi:MAG: hypothetical protein EXS16_14915 [Gemmataceae bacterium]|nr:hypothetical protein [Gemmataceae bacterium]
MSTLIEFYSGKGPDSGGRYLDEILAWDDEELEDVHDYIQWLFPTTIASNYHRNAPVLTDEEVATFRNDVRLKDTVRAAFGRFLRFLGLAIATDGCVIDAVGLEDRRVEIWVYENHNWLRVSRILGSLQTLGLETEAQAIFQWLEAAYKQGKIGSGDGNSRTEAAISFAQWKKYAQQ